MPLHVYNFNTPCDPRFIPQAILPPTFGSSRMLQHVPCPTNTLLPEDAKQYKTYAIHPKAIYSIAINI